MKKKKYTLQWQVTELRKDVLYMKQIIFDREKRNAPTHEMKKYVEEAEALIKEWQERLDSQQDVF